jgi:hypothetical protein
MKIAQQQPRVRSNYSAFSIPHFSLETCYALLFSVFQFFFYCSSAPKQLTKLPESKSSGFSTGLEHSLPPNDMPIIQVICDLQIDINESLIFCGLGLG